jgi:hypothetical protein
MIPSTSILTELARRSIFRANLQPLTEQTVVTILDARPIHAVPAREKTGFVAKYEADAGSFLMLGYAQPLEDESRSSSIAKERAVEGWHVGGASIGRPLVVKGWPTPPVVWAGGCISIDEHEVIFGGVDMTGTAEKLVAEVNGETHTEHFENGADVLFCTYEPSDDNRLRETWTVYDSRGAVLSQENSDTSLVPPP